MLISKIWRVTSANFQKKMFWKYWHFYKTNFSILGTDYELYPT